MLKIGSNNLDKCNNVPTKLYKNCKPASIKIKKTWPNKVMT